MDTSYLTQQVTSIIGQLHNLFDEIGVPHHDRDSRESELFSSLSETLHNHLRLVSKEKNDLIDEGQQVITTIKQMEVSLEDPKANPNYRKSKDDSELVVTYPLLECLKLLREKHRTVSRLHEERYEQVKKLVQALQSYSAHLEPSFVQVKLPPVTADAKVPPNFDLSPSYIAKVDNEFSRVYEEYMKRVSLVQQMGQDMINLWAELGTPQAQTDAAVVKYCRDSPEQLGLHQSDLDRLSSKREALREEKAGRERKLVRLRTEIEELWERLGIEERERKAFLSSSRGCGLRAINDMEAELSRLNELKRQNLGLFVEDARTKLNALWDELYISEEEAVEFTPMFCDVYSDALLASHEQEIARLEALKEQRAPVLNLISKHRSILKDKEDLAASSQDASRLIAKKGERRDPTRLLREEKMRKRIARDLPKVEVELVKLLSAWEDEYGREFLVFGERYLDVVELSNVKAAPPRSKTPNNFAAPTAAKSARSAPQPQRSQPQQPPLRSKTPVGNATGTLGRNAKPPTLASTAQPPATKSPSRIPAPRVPLGSRTDGGNSPERRNPPASKKQEGTVRGMNGMAPPPKMRDLHSYQNAPPAHHPGMSTPGANPHGSHTDVDRSGSVVRCIVPEDPYADHRMQQKPLPQPAYRDMPPPPRPAYRTDYAETTSTVSGSSRQISASSSVNSHGSTVNTAPSSVAASGSENWETYGSDEEDDRYATIRNASGKRPYNTGYVDGRFEGYPSQAIRGGQGAVYGSGTPAVVTANSKKMRPAGSVVTSVIDHDGRERIVSASDNGWTDDDMGETF